MKKKITLTRTIFQKPCLKHLILVYELEQKFEVFITFFGWIFTRKWDSTGSFNLNIKVFITFFWPEFEKEMGFEERT